MCLQGGCFSKALRRSFAREDGDEHVDKQDIDKDKVADE